MQLSRDIFLYQAARRRRGLHTSHGNHTEHSVFELQLGSDENWEGGSAVDMRHVQSYNNKSSASNLSDET